MPTPSRSLRLRAVAAILMGAATSSVVIGTTPGATPDALPPAIVVHATPSTMTASRGLRSEVAVEAAGRAVSRAIARQRWVATVTWNQAVARNAARARVIEAARIASRPRYQPPVPAAGDLSGVVQCIKDHESGDYGERSHLSSGSGAYQFTPDTWRHWSVSAGYGTRTQSGDHPDYLYAYLAPPAVQDDVLIYTLTHGGAGNWSPRYGNDPCTVGMQ